MHRADGGSHDAENLCLVCSSCHQAHHAGTLTITGTADRIESRRRNEPRMPAVPPIVPASSAHVCALGNDAREALVGAGWKAAIAAPAVTAALTTLGDMPTLEGVIREALRRCRQAHA